MQHIPHCQDSAAKSACARARDLLVTVRREGWAWIPAAAGADIDRLAPAIGPVMKSRTGEIRKSLLPYSIETAPRRSMSAVTGTGPQPMHTDGAYFRNPPRYVMLRCESPGESQCCTNLWSLDQNALVATRAKSLLRPGWIARGGGRRLAFYTQVLNRTQNGRFFVRFDPCCMTPPYSDKGQIQEVVTVLEGYSDIREFKWFRGKVLVIDNWRCLHGRGVGAEGSPGRRLERWLIGDGDGLDR
jgi:alpha-ketoglutarate-dependent taurine dioxygenase